MSNQLPNMDKPTTLQEDTCGCEDMKKPEFQLDAGIQGAVVLLCKAGVETVQSCEGGDGHSYAEPTVDFIGGNGAGLYALSVCVENNLPVKDLCKVWIVDENHQIADTLWRIIFYEKVYLKDVHVPNEAEGEARHQEARKVWGAFVDKTYANIPEDDVNWKPVPPEQDGSLT
jgi:hypothetical protein